MKLVSFEWIDSSTTFGWQPPEKNETVVIRSVGWLVNKTPKTITISSSQSKYGKFLDQVNVPRFAIRNYRILREVKD